MLARTFDTFCDRLLDSYVETKTVMRLVLDTNVLVAAGFRPASAAGRLVEQVRSGRHLLVWTTATRNEAEHVIGKIPRLDWRRTAELFTPEGEYKQPLDLGAFAFVEDPADRKFAALGDATGAWVISNDVDLLSVRKRLPATKVLTPSELLNIAEGAGPD